MVEESEDMAVDVNGCAGELDLFGEFVELLHGEALGELLDLFSRDLFLFDFHCGEEMIGVGGEEVFKEPFDHFY